MDPFGDLRAPRRSPVHLAFIRQLPCLATGRAPPCQPAHVRIGTGGGTSWKPDDRYTVPLADEAHQRQHNGPGELTFWEEVGIEPLRVAEQLWAVSGNLRAGFVVIRSARNGRPTAAPPAV